MRKNDPRLVTEIINVSCPPFNPHYIPRQLALRNTSLHTTSCYKNRQRCCPSGKASSHTPLFTPASPPPLHYAIRDNWSLLEDDHIRYMDDRSRHTGRMVRSACASQAVQNLLAEQHRCCGPAPGSLSNPCGSGGPDSEEPCCATLVR